jgi:alpha-glucosidase
VPLAGAEGTQAALDEAAKSQEAGPDTKPPKQTKTRVSLGMPSTSWWQRAVIYQIYPRSFQDSNGDGVGDLPGIARRLPYLVDMRIDAIWLSPIFTSPMEDFGYDVADYCGIDPSFGSMQDFDELLATCHRHGLKLLLDLVPNHTSSQHPWFIESRSSRRSSKRDWYIWRDPAPGGGPPNNWLSEFGGSAWTFDEATGQYYYHAFLASQPDLNWRHVEVRSAMHDVMRFWLRKGVDGFRIDVLWHLIKDDQFRDNPVNPDFKPGQPPHWQVSPLYTTDRPEVHGIVAGLRRVADEFDHRLLVGGIYLPPRRLVNYYGKDLEGVHLPFNFGLLEARWHARDIARLIEEYEAALPAGSWPNWVFGNHDRPRIATRVGAGQARVAAMLLLTLRCTPTIYYGDEIGMTDSQVPVELVRDPLGKSVPFLGRDGARGPMRWDAGRFAGFSEAPPWCACADEGDLPNVVEQQANPASLLSLYRRLIEARRRNAALAIGNYEPLVATGDVLLFKRSHRASPSIIVALNLGDQPAAAILHGSQGTGHVIVSAFSDRDGEIIEEEVDLRPDEGLVIEMAER